VIGPVLLMIGLTTTPASSTALLLNLESLVTMLIESMVALAGSPTSPAISAIRGPVIMCSI
jgi:drug/metabolite transporter (DMT)-like permease